MRPERRRGGHIVPKPLFAGTVMDQFREVFKRKMKLVKENRADLKGRRVLLAEE